MLHCCMTCGTLLKNILGTVILGFSRDLGETGTLYSMLKRKSDALKEKEGCLLHAMGDRSSCRNAAPSREARQLHPYYRIRGAGA